ncbi:MAG: TolC family protein [Oligoflexia bacterium]|nr:TolC family protein [Oligoflexia bacterium]
MLTAPDRATEAPESVKTGFIWLFAAGLGLWQLSWAAPVEPGKAGLGPQEALREAFSANPEIAAFQARSEAERSAVTLQYAPANPRFGFMREMNLDREQEEMGPMSSWMVSQELMFPGKYFAMGAAQGARADAALEDLRAKRLEIRQKVLSGLYNVYSARRMLSLLEAQRETLREIARSAEARRATGAVPQQDEMKAHVEQTRNENEIILQAQEVEEAEAMLNASLNRLPSEKPVLAAEALKAPKLTVGKEEIETLALRNSRVLSSGKAMVKEAGAMRSLSLLSYAPDFMLSYRRPFVNSVPGASVFSVEATIPLWFFARQTSEVSSASSRLISAEKNLEAMTREVQAQVRSLVAKVESYDKVVKVYESALVPQATVTLNSSRAAYGAGRTGFLELLDSERSLYEVRMGYYRSLARFVEVLTELEKISGVSLSTLPFGEE